MNMKLNIYYVNFCNVTIVLNNFNHLRQITSFVFSKRTFFYFIPFLKATLFKNVIYVIQ